MQAEGPKDSHSLGLRLAKRLGLFRRLYSTLSCTSFWIGQRIKITLRQGGPKNKKYGADKGFPGQREKLRLGVGGGGGEEGNGDVDAARQCQACTNFLILPQLNCTLYLVTRQYVIRKSLRAGPSSVGLLAGANVPTLQLHHHSSYCQWPRSVA
jgi:hypothetical protein